MTRIEYDRIADGQYRVRLVDVKSGKTLEDSVFTTIGAKPKKPTTKRGKQRKR